MTDQITEIIREQIATVVREAVQQRLDEYLDQLILDDEYQQQIQDRLVRNFTARFAQQVSHVDMGTLVVEHLDTALQKWRDLLQSSFESRGISDQAESRQITVTQDVTVFNNAVSTTMLGVDQDAEVSGSLSVNDLVVRNTVNTDAPAWQQLTDTLVTNTLERITADWRDSLVKDVLALARRSGIDFEDVTIGGHPLVMGDRLNPGITVTNIQKIGVLDRLRVSGDADLQDTMHVRNRRVGINTQSPDMALTVWDEEVSLSMGKINKDAAYIGTSRRQSLSLGVNRRPVLSIDVDNLVTVPQLRVDRWKIQFSNTLPGWEGTRGDLVINHDPRPGTAFAWQCLGGTRWQILRLEVQA